MRLISVLRVFLLMSVAFIVRSRWGRVNILCRLVVEGGGLGSGFSLDGSAGTGGCCYGSASFVTLVVFCLFCDCV